MPPLPREHKRLASAVRTHAERAARGAQQQRIHKALVVRDEPLAVELPQSRIKLDEDALLLTQMMRLHQRDHGFNVGDSVMLMEDGDDLVVFDVISDLADDFDGVTTVIEDSGDVTLTAPGGGGAVTQSHHITAKMEVRDADGNTVGWIPIYATLPS